MNGRGYRELPPDAPPPRLCVIQKQYVSQEYGFNLHAEKERGQFIGAIDPGSPADIGGLKKGDKIFAVNGVSISGRNHKDVVAEIKSDPLKCEMLVVSDEDYEWYSSRDIPIDMTLPNILRVCEEFYDEATSISSSSLIEKSKATTISIKSSDSPPTKLYRTTIEVRPPLSSFDSSSFTSYSDSSQSSMRSMETDTSSTKKRQSVPGKPVVGGGSKPSMAPPARLSILQKQSLADEFGFNLQAERGKGHFIGAVDKEGIADKAGLIMGQRIVGVNGTLIYPNTPHKEVVGLIKRDPLCTELLVVSEEIDRWYSENGVEFSFENCVRYNNDSGPPRISIPKIDVMETRTQVEKLNIQDETVESHPVESESSDESASEPDDTIKQVTTVSTTQTLSVAEAASEPQEHNEELTNEGFKGVPLLSSGAEGSHHDGILSSDGASEGHRLPSSTAEESSTSTTRVASPVTQDPSPKPVNQVPLVVPPTSVVRTQSSEIKPQASPSSHGSSSPGSRTNGTEVDIFKMNAKEARRMLQRQKTDPRKNNISLEQKHRMVANL